MNGYEFALSMEADGRAYYEKLMRQSGNNAVKTIFKMLAEDEQAHYDAIQSGQEDLPASMAADHAANVFEELEQTGAEIPFEAGEEALRHALDIEFRSIRLYEELADKTEDAKAKALFRKLVGEEGNHYVIVENLLDHLSGGLLRGIESAEFPPLSQ